MIVRFLVTMLVISSVAACAPKRWSRYGTGQDVAQRDFAECQYQVNLSTAGMRNTLANFEQSAQLINQCMSLRGYN